MKELLTHTWSFSSVLSLSSSFSFMYEFHVYLVFNSKRQTVNCEGGRRTAGSSRSDDSENKLDF